MFAQLLAQLYAHQITPCVLEELILLDVQSLIHATGQALCLMELLHVQMFVLYHVHQITCGVMVELMQMDAKCE